MGATLYLMTASAPQRTGCLHCQWNELQHGVLDAQRVEGQHRGPCVKLHVPGITGSGGCTGPAGSNRPAGGLALLGKLPRLHV
jgi:hypothetical protein|eukprot:4152770-Prymnesium_polylepis.7